MKWSNWEKFPDPGMADYLSAPFGMGIYQLRNKKTKELVLFGSGKNLAYRMTSLLPKPFGCGTRNNQQKRNYVLKHLENIEYRTMPFLCKNEMRQFENKIKLDNNHIFNT